MNITIPEPSQGISLSQQRVQGYLTLPWTPLPITICTGFSTSLAAATNRDPFIYDASPFDFAQGRQRFIYAQHGACTGDFASTSSTNFGSASEHLSVALGVSVGNEYINAGVTGSYDKSVLANKAASKSSRKSSFQAGHVRSYTRPNLSAEAIALLKSGGLPGFTNIYGDFYVDSFVIGAESAVFVYTSSLNTITTENVQLLAEAQLLCFSDTETIADESFVEAHSSITFGITAFDTLDGQFVDIGNDSQKHLSIEQTRALGIACAAKADLLPERVQKPLTRLRALFGLQEEPFVFDRDVLQAIISSGLISQIVLLPFERLRGVQEALGSVELNN